MKKALLIFALLCGGFGTLSAQKPNVIYIYADDLGYGDLSCYGATKLHTPNLDKLAASGIRFTNGHSTSATCTPSRYAFMTGRYPWRQKGTGILPGDASLIIPLDKPTVPKLFKSAGYVTAIVGKWHLGLGNQVEKNWNAEIKPGPNEVGFDYSFIFPATADRVPTVFLENGNVQALDANDPIAVNYAQQIGNDPTGAAHPELLKMLSSVNQGHNNTIVNGIGRIGWMSGGKMARWTDEEVSFTFLAKAKDFIDSHKEEPFFLYMALTEPHVPRVPATMFKGKSGLGVRGDVILQLDWTIGQVMDQLVKAGIANHTMIVFTSDNGPVLDDGYQDEAVTKLNGHTPLGPLRGGKYSALEGGTRVPLIISLPSRIKPQVSDALVSQMDFLASFSDLLKIKLPDDAGLDSQHLLPTFLGKSNQSRSELVTQGGAFSILKGDWKYIIPNKGVAYNQLVGYETGNLTEAQLYNLKLDIGEKDNQATKFPEKVKELANTLQKIKTQPSQNENL